MQGKIMAAPKKYFQDHLILLLLSINAFLTLSAVGLVLVRLASGHGDSYIAQYRSSLGINAFQSGSILDLLSFAVFAVLVLGVHTLLSIKTYPLSKQVSAVILSLGIVLLLLALVISNALLVLR